MELTGKAALMLSVIVGALVLGYAGRKSGRVPEGWSAGITRNTMTFVQPIVLALMIWGLKPPGWQTSLSHIRHTDELPREALDYIRRIEELTGARVSAASVGAERSQTVLTREVSFF